MARAALLVARTQPPPSEGGDSAWGGGGSASPQKFSIEREGTLSQGGFLSRVASSRLATGRGGM